MPKTSSDDWLERTARAMAVVGIAFPLFLITNYYRAGRLTFLSTAFLGAFSLHLFCRPPRKELLAVVVLALVFGSGYIWLHGEWEPAWAARAIAAASLLGVGSMVVNGWRVLSLPPCAERAGRLRALLPAAAVVAFLAYNPIFFRLLNLYQTLSYDRILYVTDDKLGFQAGFLMGQIFERLPVLQVGCAAIYLSLPLALLLLHAAIREDRQRRRLMTGFLLTGIAGGVLYNIVPAAGPVYVFGDLYPHHPPAITADFVRVFPVQGVRLNAMPSLHTVWVLLLLWHARRLARGIRCATAGFVFFTLVATLGLGEHYLIDLLVAAPLAVSVETGLARRFALSLAGFAIALAWMAAIRFQWAIALNTALLWIVLLASVLGPLWALSRAARESLRG